MEKTILEYHSVVSKCKDIFISKLKDYGASWRIMRPSSVTDQLFIKAQRIRSIEEKGFTKVDEGVVPEFMGIVNYCIIALIQLELGSDDKGVLNVADAEVLYDKYAKETFELMKMKNHDYGEAWRDMRVSSLTDIILMRIFRIKQIEDNQGETSVSEGVDSNYMDMLNYAVFALIKLEEAK